MLVNYGLDEQTAGCTENWLSDWAQRVEISGATSSWRPVLVCTPGVNTGSRPDQLMMIWMIEQSVLTLILMTQNLEGLTKGLCCHPEGLQ